jgi:hypothetical protein
MARSDNNKFKKNIKNASFAARYKRELVFVLACFVFFCASLSWLYISKKGFMPALKKEIKSIEIETDKDLKKSAAENVKEENILKYQEFLKAGFGGKKYKAVYKVLGLPEYMMNGADDYFVSVVKYENIVKNAYSFMAESEKNYTELYILNGKNYACSRPGSESFIMGMGFFPGCKELLPEIDRQLALADLAAINDEGIEIEYEGTKERLGRECEFFRIKNENQNLKRYFSFGSQYDYELIESNKEVCFDKETSLPVFIRLSYAQGDRDIIYFAAEELSLSVEEAETVSASPFSIEKAGKKEDKIIFFLKPFGYLDREFVLKTKKIELEGGEIIEGNSTAAASSSPGGVFKLEFETDTEADLYDLCYLDHCQEVSHFDIISAKCLEYSLDEKSCSLAAECKWEDPYCLYLFCEKAFGLDECAVYPHCEWKINEQGEYCSDKTP